MPESQPRSSNGSLLLIFVIAFLNTASATIVMPVTPFIAQRFVHNPAALGLWVGVLASSYSLCALLAAPALGALSDRVGRKPVLLACLIGSAIGFVIFGIGGALWVLLLGRVIDGLTGGNISTIFAYLADVTPPAERAKRFGLAGAITGVGFMIGPAIGGLLAQFGLSAPVYVAAGITLLTAAIIAFALPESLDIERLEVRQGVLAGNPVAVRPAVERPVVEDREVTIRGGMDVEFDDIRAQLKGSSHRWDGVLDEPVSRRIDASGRARVI